MPSDIEQVKRLFDERGITLSPEWLHSCVEWCKSDNLPRNYRIKDLQMMVYEQWLWLDLREINVGTLPPNLSSAKKFNLTGVYYLQLMQVVDISKPKFWQLQRIRNTTAKNLDIEKDFGKRVLQLRLTDGAQEIEAMEFKPIPCLNINLAPGTKLEIIGPVMVRNGRLMLEEKHIKKLGGSVDTITVDCAAENVLARALGLEENPTPNTIDEKALEVDDTTTQTQNLQKTNWQPNRNSGRTDIPSIVSKQAEIPPEFQVDDELLRELEEGFEDNNFSERGRKSSRNVNKTPRNCGSPDLFEEEMDIDDSVLLQHFDQIESSAVAIPKSSNNDNEIINLDDSFDDIDIDNHLDRIDADMAQLPSSSQAVRTFKNDIKSPQLKSSAVKKLRQSKLTFDRSGSRHLAAGRSQASTSTQNHAPAHFASSTPVKPNVMSIEKLRSLIPNVNTGKFKIKGKFVVVVEKLKVVENQFHLVITVSDGTGKLDVQIRSDIVAGFAKIDPERLQELREMVLKQDQKAKLEICTVLTTLHSKCLSLDNVLELQITRGAKYPLVVTIFDSS